MKYLEVRGQTSNIAFVFLADSTSTTGAGKTGMTNASAGLNISIIRELSSTMTAYTGGNIGTITTIGTWVDPGAGKCNFKEVDSTNAPGLYQLHFVDLIFGASDNSRILAGMVTATGVVPGPLEIVMSAVNIQSATGFVASVSSVTGAVGSVTGAVGSVTGSVNSVATAVTLGANEDTALTRLFTMTNATPEFTTTALSQAPTGGGATPATIWSDLLSNAEFSVAGGIGQLLATNVNAAITSRQPSGNVNLNLSQALDMTQVPVTTNTVGTALLGGVSGLCKVTIVGTTMDIFDATGLILLKSFTISPTPTGDSSRQ